MNYWKWKHAYDLKPQKRFLYLCIVFFVGLALLLSIFSNSKNTQILSETSNSYQVGLDTESNVWTSSSAKIIYKRLQTITADPSGVANSKVTENIKIKEQSTANIPKPSGVAVKNTSKPTKSTRVKEQLTTTTADKLMPSHASVNRSSITSININELKLKSIDVKQLIKNLTNPKSYKESFTQALTASQVNEIANIFGLPSLNYSLDLKRQFLDCSGIQLLRLSVKEGGILHIPQHYQTCKNMSFKKSKDFVALLSWPGSGNSWVRQLLETTTGIYTGALYCDPNYIHAGMFGEGIQNSNVLVMKIHFHPNPKWLPERIIYIVRNPFDCILAEWNRLLQEKKHPMIQHTAIASQESFGEYVTIRMPPYN